MIDIKTPHVNRDLATFRGADFRHQTFRVKRTIDSLVTAGSLLPYRELCRLLREYLIRNELIGIDGEIHCDPLLKTLINKETTTFFEIVRYFRSIVE